MRKLLIIFLCIVSILVLASCSNDKTDDENNTDGAYNLAQNIQDGVILHAWNWSYKTIEDNLKNIAEAGFSAVQTSPVQQPKSYNPLATSIKQSWWKLYQPVSFSIGDAWLGDKDDLTSLCSKANEYGIKIIVDIVANHMGNVQDYEGYASEIETHEPTIYNDTNQFFHPYKNANNQNFATSDSSAYTVTQGSLGGLPDLNTKNPYIQERVLSLLKECIDCGVSGFRFDAAKHIETPDDGEYASSFWPTVVNGAKDYAKNQYNRDIYCYGEILNTPGGGRDINSYVDYMSVTDNETSSNITSSINSRSVDRAISATSRYIKQVDANKIVLWVESHDTYIDDSVSNVKTLIVNKSWSILANRKDATALFFARPGDAGMGECGNYNWMSQEVAATNRFHNYFIGAEEKIEKAIYNGEDFIINNRTIGKKAGVIITKVKTNSNIKTNIVKIPVENLPTGTYYDHISGNEFIVKKDSEGKLVAEGLCSASGIIILYDQPLNIRGSIPTLSYTSESNYFYAGGSTQIRIKYENSDNVYYQINGGEKTPLPESKIITLTEACTVIVTAEGYVNTTLKINVGTPEKRVGYWCIGGVSDSISDSQQVYAWVWGKNADGSWREVEFVDNYYYIEQRTDDYGMLLAYFPAGTKITDASWDLAPAQTSDMGLPLKDDVVYTAD